jgi:hypothetical protein|tara:strand:+ start:658 stop:1068 length:411 start_codon:yes stop_codon:yes gene_type:complete
MTKDFRSLFEEEVTSEVVSEVASIQTRMKLKRAMRKNKSKIAFARKKAMKRKILDPKILMKRAQKQARAKVAKRILKGKSQADLGMGQKRALEKILDKKTKAISKLAKKMLKVVRQKEMNKGKKKLEDIAPPGAPK